MKVEIHPFFSGPFWSTVVQFDDLTCLIDCGWQDSLDLKDIHPLLKWLDPPSRSNGENCDNTYPQPDLVLLSHYTFQHLGAFPFLHNRFWRKEVTSSSHTTTRLSKKAPCLLATYPIQSLGKLAACDVWNHGSVSPDVKLRTIDIQNAFASLTCIHYNEPLTFDTASGKLTIRAISAGHTLGGSIWVFNLAEQEIVYGVNYNIGAECHLNPSALVSVKRPNLFITNVLETSISNNHWRTPAIRHILERTKNVLKNEGSVLIPLDLSGRLMELLICFNSFWSLEGTNMAIYPLYFISSYAKNFLQFSKSLLNWASDYIRRDFCSFRSNPFDGLKHVTLVESIEKIEKLPEGPKVIITTPASLDIGFSKNLFAMMASDSRNLIFTIGIPRHGSLAHKLWDENYLTTEKSKTSSARPKLNIALSKRIQASDAELYNLYTEERDRRLAEQSQENDGERHSDYEADALNQHYDSVNTSKVAAEIAPGFQENKGNFEQPSFTSRNALLDTQMWKVDATKLSELEQSSSLHLNEDTMPYGVPINESEKETWKAFTQPIDASIINKEDNTNRPSEKRKFANKSKNRDGSEKRLKVIEDQSENDSTPDSELEDSESDEMVISPIPFEETNLLWKETLQEWIYELPFEICQSSVEVSICCMGSMILGLEGTTGEQSLRRLLSSLRPRRLALLPSCNSVCLNLLCEFLSESSIPIHEIYCIKESHDSSAYPAKASLSPLYVFKDTMVVELPSERVTVQLDERLWCSVYEQMKKTLPVSQSVKKQNEIRLLPLQAMAKIENYKNEKDTLMQTNKTTSSLKNLQEFQDTMPSNVLSPGTLFLHRAFLRDLSSQLQSMLPGMVKFLPQGGATALSNKAIISKVQKKSVSKWRIDGTLDPLYYVARNSCLKQLSTASSASST